MLKLQRGFILHSVHCTMYISCIKEAGNGFFRYRNLLYFVNFCIRFSNKSVLQSRKFLLCAPNFKKNIVKKREEKKKV